MRLPWYDSPGFSPMDFESILFINEPIQAIFDEPPLLEKKPGCPSGFYWKQDEYLIREILSEWHDYGRRGRMAKNMKASHSSIASIRGSWGVGQDFYRIKTTNGQIFDIYFDRAPIDVNQRKGNWYIFRELRIRG